MGKKVIETDAYKKIVKRNFDKLIIQEKVLQIKLDRVSIAKADIVLQLLKVGVPYEDAKKILGI